MVTNEWKINTFMFLISHFNCVDYLALWKTGSIVFPTEDKHTLWRYISLLETFTTKTKWLLKKRLRHSDLKYNLCRNFVINQIVCPNPLHISCIIRKSVTTLNFTGISCMISFHWGLCATSLFICAILTVLISNIWCAAFVLSRICCNRSICS